MSEPTLSSVFGDGASQTSTTLTISKADLPGLTATANNTAESLLVALLLKAKAGLSQENFDQNIDQSVYISTGYPSFTFRGQNNDSYRIDQFTINLAKPDIEAEIDPDDY